MKSRSFWLVLCFAWMLLIASLILAGCTRVRPETVAEQFFALWAEQDYQAMYELLSSSSWETYTEDYFVERYTNISRGIGLQGVKLGEIERTASEAGRVELSLDVRLETSTVGSIPLHYRVEMSCEKRGAPWLLHWHPGLIFPDLSGDRRVDLKRSCRGEALLLTGTARSLPGRDRLKRSAPFPAATRTRRHSLPALKRYWAFPRRLL